VSSALKAPQRHRLLEAQANPPIRGVPPSALPVVSHNKDGGAIHTSSKQEEKSTQAEAGKEKKGRGAERESRGEKEWTSKSTFSSKGGTASVLKRCSLSPICHPSHPPPSFSWVGGWGSRWTSDDNARPRTWRAAEQRETEKQQKSVTEAVKSTRRRGSQGRGEGSAQ
jgi:hypothetical protein